MRDFKTDASVNSITNSGALNQNRDLAGAAAIPTSTTPTLQANEVTISNDE